MAATRSQLTQPILAAALTRLAGQSRSNHSVQGITLVECLIAIAVIALASAMITPPLFIAAATRLQNQRAEQALQIAQGEVESIRFLVERGLHTPSRLPPPGANPLSNTAAPTSIAASTPLKSPGACNTYTGQSSVRLLLVDVDGDCEADFLVQRFRSLGTVPNRDNSANSSAGQNRPGEFLLGIRVYAKPAIASLGQGGTLEIEPASLQFTNGEGNMAKRPMAVLFSQVNWSDRDFSLCQFQSAPPTGGGTARNCPQQ